MSLFLRQSTAKVVSFGPMLDRSDGVTEEVGLVSALDHGTTGIKLSKNGGALTIRHAAVTASTYDALGHYRVTLDTTDTDTVGTLHMAFNEAATCLPVWQDFQVIEETIFDALFAAAAPGYLQPTTAGRTLDVTATGAAGIDWGNIENKTTSNDLNGTSIDSATNVSDAAVSSVGLGAITSSSFAADALTAAALATDAVTEIQSGLATAAALIAVAGYIDTEVAAIKAKTDYLPSATAGAAGGVFIAGSNAATAANITGNITGNLSGSVGSVTGAVGSVTGNVGGTVDGLVVAIATIDANVDAILVDTTEIGVAGAGLTALPWNAAWDTEVQSEVQDALEVNHLDHLLAADYDPASKPGTATALLNELIGSDAGVSQFTANALELAPSGGGGGTADWTADERTALRTILGIPASGTTPEVPSAGALKVIDDLIDTEVAAIKAQTDLIPASPAAVGSAMTLAADAVSASALSAAAVDEILDEVVEGSTTVRMALRALLSLAAGKSSRSGSTIYLRDIGDTKNRVAITHDSNADRTAVTVDLT